MSMMCVPICCLKVHLHGQIFPSKLPQTFPYALPTQIFQSKHVVKHV